MCVCVYIWYTDNVTTHMNGKRRLMATKLNQMPLFFFHVVVVCLVNQPNFVCMNRKKYEEIDKKKDGEKEKIMKRVHRIALIVFHGWVCFHCISLCDPSYFSSNFMT